MNAPITNQHQGTYRVVRYYYRGTPKTVHGYERVTREEAMKHCQRPDTRGPLMCGTHGKPKGRELYGEAHCPTCGFPMVAEWFDGWTAN